mmetsp:Transcript_36963/g.104327  ORF Transcript_36963/g.104327 Transcript_36963/m.104327 type:complete len:410 (+) Transcript_36963:377-1606(+)
MSRSEVINKPPQPAFMEGFLNKRNTKSGKFYLNQWNKRWFELSGDTLTYAKSPKDVTSGEITVFAVHELQDIRRVDNSSFELRFPERRVLLQSSSSDSAQQWIAALQDAMAASMAARPIKSSAAGIGRGLLDGELGRDGSSTPKIERGHGYGDSRASNNVIPDRPPSPRSLLANPAAFGKFQGEGRLFRQPSGGSPPAMEGQQAYQTPPRTKAGVVATTTIETFEPAPSTPPAGSLRSKHAQGSSNPRSQKQHQARLGVREIRDDDQGITTIQLATPPATVKSQLLSPDEDWLQDDWDEDEDGRRDGDCPPSSRSRMVPNPPRATKPSAEAFRPLSSSRSQTPSINRGGVYEETELRDFLSPPETPQHSKMRMDSTVSRLANTSLQDQPSAPAVNADTDWLEEDWDSDE